MTIHNKERETGRMIKEEVAQEVRELLQRPRDCFINSAHPAMEDPEHWCVGPVVLTRDSHLLDQANYQSLVAELEEHPEWEEEWQLHSFSHWAVGWVEHLSFRVLTEEGKPTAMFQFVKKWFEALSEYPSADDELYSKLEYEACLEAIESEGRRWIRDGVEEGWPETVWRWLDKNDPGELENRDGNGAYPDGDKVREALRALELHEPEDDEEEEEEVLSLVEDGDDQ